MKEADRIKGENIIKKRVRGLNSDVVVFAFFLFLSFIFWYINSLGKDSEADIRYAVEYVNLPKERILTEETPAKLYLNLKGPGFEIIKLKLAGASTLFKIDISKVNYKRVQGTGNRFNFYILTSGLTKSLRVQLRSECEIISIKPDTLFFALDKRTSVSD